MSDRESRKKILSSEQKNYFSTGTTRAVNDDDSEASPIGSNDHKGESSRSDNTEEENVSEKVKQSKRLQKHKLSSSAKLDDKAKPGSSKKKLRHRRSVKDSKTETSDEDRRTRTSSSSSTSSKTRSSKSEAGKDSETDHTDVEDETTDSEDETKTSARSKNSKEGETEKEGSKAKKDGESDVTYDEVDTTTPDTTDDELGLLQSRTDPPFWQGFVLEPVLLLYSFTTYLMLTVVPNLLMEKICESNFNETPEVCFNLSNSSEIFDEVQKETADYDLYMNLISNLPAALVALIVAAWSENHGRKTPICFVILCTIVYDALMIWYLSSSGLPVYYMLLICIPIGLSGGFACIQYCIYIMAPDFSIRGHRIEKFTYLELSRFLGKSLGTLCCGLLYESYGYLPIFWVCLGCHIVLFAHTILLVHDRTVVLMATTRKKVEDLWKFQDHSKLIFKSAVKKRENKGRFQLIFLLAFLPMITHLGSGLGGVQYLYCNKMYGWSVGYFSAVNTAGSIVEIILTLVIVLCVTKCCTVPDSVMGAFGVGTNSVQNVLKAFANVPWMFYTDMMMTLQSSVDSLSPLVVQVIFTRLYKAGVSIFLGLAYAVGGIVLLVPLAGFVWMMCLKETPASQPAAEEGSVDENQPSTSEHTEATHEREEEKEHDSIADKSSRDTLSQTSEISFDK